MRKLRFQSCFVLLHFVSGNNDGFPLPSEIRYLGITVESKRGKKVKVNCSIVPKRYFEEVQYYLQAYCDKSKMYIVNSRASISKV